MNVGSKWKIGLCLAALFLTGAATGSLVTLKVIKHVVSYRTNPKNLEAVAMQRLNRRLNLSSEQQEQVKPIVDQLAQRIGGARSQMLFQSALAMREARREIEPILTPSQQSDLRKMAEERRARLREFSIEPDTTNP